MVEMENTKLDHDQEILRLKGQIQRLTPTSKQLVFIFKKNSFYYLEGKK
jgi:hypothetical protein